MQQSNRRIQMGRLIVAALMLLVAVIGLLVGRPLLKWGPETTSSPTPTETPTATAIVPTPTETPTPTATPLPAGGRILWGHVYDFSTRRRIGEASVFVIKTHPIEPAHRRFCPTEPDGRYECADLYGTVYDATAKADDYAQAGPWPVDLEGKMKHEFDFWLVPINKISSTPFQDGTLESVFSVTAPLSPIKGDAPLGLIATVKDAKVVALHATGFEREMIDMRMAITNTTEWPVYVDFSRSYLLGRHEGALPEESYETLYRFDAIGTQFLPDRMPGPLTMIEAGDTIERNIAFADLEELSIRPDIENITPVLCASVAPSSPWQPLDFQGFFHDSVWSPDYLPRLLCQ